MDKPVEEGLEPYYEITPEEDAMITAMIEQADREIAERHATGNWEPDEDLVPVEPGAAARVPEDARVNMRWPRTQLEVVREAAELFGMPYQTYIKQAAFRAALDDLVKVRTAVPRGQKPPAETRQEDAAQRVRQPAAHHGSQSDGNQYCPPPVRADSAR